MPKFFNYQKRKTNTIPTSPQPLSGNIFLLRYAMKSPSVYLASLPHLQNGVDIPEMVYCVMPVLEIIEISGNSGHNDTHKALLDANDGNNL